jgi:hypothetical protein
LAHREVTEKRRALRENGFDLAKLFPTLCATLAKPNSGNVWFKIYQRRVMVAAGMTKCKLVLLVTYITFCLTIVVIQFSDLVFI